MQVWMRLVRVGFRALRDVGRVGVDYVSSLDFRVAVGDVDVNLHMNNGRYLTIMDLGRIDILIRSGLYREMRLRKLMGVVAVQRVRYRLALDPFEKFRLESRIVGWTDDSLVFEHRMLRVKKGEEKLAASATVRFVFVARARGAGRIRPADVLAAAGMAEPSPALPEEVAAWLAAERRASGSRVAA